MLVLLPPSEGKATGATGPALDLEALSLPALTVPREAVLEELVELCSADADKAREVLGLGEGLRGEVARNAALRTAPTLPAGEVYTGVLYDALDLASLDAAERERAGRWLLVFSGLWGAVRTGDPIPPYRCSGTVRLPGLGSLARHWREPLGAVLPEAAGDGPVLDLRSAAYGAMWRPKGELAERTATVRVLQSRVVGGVEKRSVVSHFNKATKGRIVRALLRAGEEPGGPAELAGLLRELGYAVECEAPAKGGTPWRLDVVVTEV
ncbi:peroxide stress protein YaaA [Streptomyces desertarenae]|uniref:Peroxide stress protein YaaA n=1 Tax=Streptomyces desertarenae TaxID=2666184 RepID=A0ABW4PGF6_9ACTN